MQYLLWVSVSWFLVKLRLIICDICVFILNWWRFIRMIIFSSLCKRSCALLVSMWLSVCHHCDSWVKSISTLRYFPISYENTFSWSHSLSDFHEIFNIKPKNKYSFFFLWFSYKILFILFLMTWFKHKVIFFSSNLAIWS